MNGTTNSTTGQLVWFITGTTSGFGHRLVKLTLSRGDLVIATARSLEKLEALYSDSSKNESLHLLRLDITDGFDKIKDIVQEAIKFWGRIDVLVNNAGNGYLGIVEEATSEMYRRQFETNVFGIMDVTNAVLPYMRARKSGTIVTIGSRSVWRADTPGIGAYAASKAAIHAVTEALAVEVAPLGIRTLLVAPGAFRTENIYGIPFHTSNPITDYNAMRESVISQVTTIPGSEPGDPDKGMEVIVDIVRGEGVAKGKKWPGTLVLGEDAESTFNRHWEILKKSVDEWAQVTRNVAF
ncbi:short-chain oxidoreductase [Moniliophthora roreri MCA 2997]|uniref:Short-chain oxidoreductase n=1 Tax=Moniliophthora roreri (strain MCA 2997) TaxID=1381753 RepID=V2X2R3_MONRO|nr:short-chain oxidoreductase [Moniliophthora roreri MCA 2997]